VLERLDSYACYEIGRKIIPATGRIRMFGRNAHIGKIWANVEVTFFESLEGLEARLNGQWRGVAVLKDYRSFRQMPPYRWSRELPRALYFESRGPRIAGAP
jgi:hypothetical protein